MSKLQKQNDYSKKNYLKRGDGLRNKLKKQRSKKGAKKPLKYENTIISDFPLVFRADTSELEITPCIGWNFKECEILSSDPFLIRVI